MSAPRIDDYLLRLREHLAWRTDVDDIVDECADHLWTAFERAVDRGIPDEDAELEALRRVGPLPVVGHGFEDGGADRRSVPTMSTRWAGLAAAAAGVGWIVVGVGWFGAYFRPGSWWGHLAGLLFPVLPLLVAATAAGLTGLHLRLARPLHTASWVAVGIAALAAVLAAVLVDATALWCSLLGLASGLTAAVLRGRSTLALPPVCGPLIALWWLATVPAQIVLQIWSDLNLVVIAAGWSAGFIALGSALVLIGRTLWPERVAARVPSPSPAL